MQLEGKAVVHKIFGNGTVTDSNASVVTVSFSQGEKKFIYPDAFMKFLTLKDDKTQSKIEDKLNEKAQLEEEKRQAELAELERIDRLRRFKRTPNSQAVFGCVSNSAKDIFSGWCARTGQYLSGYSKGEPKIPSRLRPNSACIVTECPDKNEAERAITGVFMVQEDFFGDTCSDGIIVGHQTFRLALKPEESLLFWSYFEETDRLAKWGNTEMKYLSNAVVLKMLCDMKNAVTDPKRQQIAQQFYEYYCKINRLSPIFEELKEELDEQAV